ncbi:MAG: RDD family protein [Acidimicrobiales bacterium]|nr:RDD family protein [Acidimicrobiales bacterium]MYK70779.1 RDD family protein [Acidimicrobiales bacterium]
MSKPSPADPPTEIPGERLLPGDVEYASPWLRLGAMVLENFLVVVTLGIGWVIWALIIVRRGQTPAKSLLGLRVIDDATLEPVGFVRMFFVRGLVGDLITTFAFILTVGVLAFMPFWDRRNQTLWEKLSNTHVVVDPIGGSRST